MRSLRSRHLSVLVILAIFVWGSLCPAQNAVKPAAPSEKSKPAEKPAAAQQKDEEDERVIIEWADRMHQEGDIYRLRGNVVFARQDMKLYCDEADYDENADTAKARGNLRIVNPDSVITGDVVEADFGKELAVITGNVRVITQKKQNEKSSDTPGMTLEKPSGLADAAGANESASQPATAGDKPKNGEEPEHLEDYWEKKSTITCERLEYYYGDDAKKMIATPRVKAVQEDKTVWADTAVFEDLRRVITLTGNVVLNTDKGDELRCTKAVVYIDEDRVDSEGVKGMTLRKQRKEEPAPPAGKPQAPAVTEPETEGGS